ncbi:MAG: shikimate dehydrogenase [Clostridia bacterium]|nr:shikimate dehydrogenase [Clostridia bacterium]
MKQYGCIGKKLTHSFSKEIHARLADYAYELIELSEEEIRPFFEKKAFAAINVTIPYKQTVIPFLDEVSSIAQRIGAVNTIVNRDGKLYGYNTDYYGMKALIEKAGLELSGKKVLILGTGGTSKTAHAVAQDLGAADILTVSRRKSEGCITYEEATCEHADAQVIINTTPAGMYPDCEGQPMALAAFDALEGVIDAVYNPLSTNLVLNARQKGAKAEGGLYMLVMQAVVAAEKFLDIEIPKEKADAVYASVLASKENIVLTGMPGSGKSTVGRLLDVEGFEFVDTDAEIEKRCGCTIRELIESKGETYFRDLESEVIRDVSAKGCRIISTGGGAVLREDNVQCLKRNGSVFFLHAALGRLRATKDRPLSDTDEKLAALYAARMPVYEMSADVTVPDMETPGEEAAYILKKRMELIV